MVCGAKKYSEQLITNQDRVYGIVVDSCIGFPKRYLYLGESALGECWNLFLLFVARERKYHRVRKVIYDF